MISKRDIIEDFINTFAGVRATVIDNSFHKLGGSKFTLDSGVVECFTQGCCYWFAVILKERFSGKIVYEPVIKHFACEIDGHIYDITGDCDATYGPQFMNWADWDSYEINEDGSPSDARQEIINHCILKYNDDLNDEYLKEGGTLF